MLIGFASLVLPRRIGPASLAAFGVVPVGNAKIARGFEYVKHFFRVSQRYPLKGVKFFSVAVCLGCPLERRADPAGGQTGEEQRPPECSRTRRRSGQRTRNARE